VSNFISFVASIAELAQGKKLHTQSLTHSLSLFDAPETEALVLQNFGNSSPVLRV